MVAGSAVSKSGVAGSFRRAVVGCGTAEAVASPPFSHYSRYSNFTENSRAAALAASIAHTRADGVTSSVTAFDGHRHGSAGEEDEASELHDTE